METINDWHDQFLHQSRWTKDIVKYITNKASLTYSSKIIEIGCGTGAILERFPANFDCHGIEINPSFAKFTKKKFDKKIIIGDGNTISIKENSFHLVYCHFLLLWVANPQNILKEMKRITKPGGMIAVLAEPDYSERFDQPIEFSFLGKAQTKSLRHQGANPQIGGQLTKLFSPLNLENIEIGEYTNSQYARTEAEWDAEWKILAFDLRKNNFPESMKKYEEFDKKARRNGTRKLTIPTHFALGKKRRSE